MKDKIVLITGANSGLGAAAAMELAQMGAQVIMVCRNEDSGRSASQKIKKQVPSAILDLLIADFSAQSSIRSLALQVLERYDRLDVLINNAGAINSKRLTTVDGLEMTFAVNHLGYFLLTNLLLDLLRQSAPSRVINVSSAAHHRSPLDFNDLQNEVDYNRWIAYGRSKLANIYFTYSLAKKLERDGITVNCMHPGLVATGFGRNGNTDIRFGMRLGRPFLLSPKKGAETIVWLASSAEVENVTGKYFEKKRNTRTSDVSYKTEIAEKLWIASEMLTGLNLDNLKQ